MADTPFAPLVSVLMPAYNHAPYVGAAVESVLGQTYAHLELIVVDDASTDTTWSVLQSFKDERLVISRHETNQGAHATLNDAWLRARGDFIAIINSDDVYYPERLQKMVSHLMASPNLGACFSRYDFIDGSGNLGRDADSLAAEFPDAKKYLGAMAKDVSPCELQVLTLLARNYLHTTSNLVCHREVIEKIGLFGDFRYVHDHEFFLRLSFRYPIDVLQDSLLGYRFHSTNTLAESATASVAETAAMLAEFFLTHELKSMQRDHPAALWVLRYLLENFKTYGADKLMLLLVLAESTARQKTEEMETPMFRDWAADPFIQRWLGVMLNLERAVEDLQWQKVQTTKWWETAKKRSNQLVRRKIRQDRIGKILWDVRQSLSETRQSLWETQQSVINAERQLEWWRDRYQRTLEARIRAAAKSFVDKVLNGCRSKNQ